AGILAGAVLGFVIGLFEAKLGIPSFVVTLAFFLGLQGGILKPIGQGGSVRVSHDVIRGITIDNMSVTAGWALAVVLSLGYASVSLRRHRIQVSRGLQHQPLSVVVLKIVGIAAIAITVAAV